MSRPVVWITGAGGLIGNQLVRLAGVLAPDLSVVALTRAALDLEDFAAVDRRFETERPALILHCAGLTRSPECQANPTRARRLNVEATSHLARLADTTVMVFFSTDLVFDGSRGDYVEMDDVNPLSVYAETKAEAERSVLACPRHLVIRTSLNYGRSPTGDRAFNEDMLATVRRGGRLRLFTDEFRCPIPAEVTARATWAIARRMLGDAGPAAQERPRGILHLAGAERLSRWAIGDLVARTEPELRGRIEPASLKEYRGAPRAPDTSLNCARAQALLDFPLPRFGEWLLASRPGPA